MSSHGDSGRTVDQNAPENPPDCPEVCSTPDAGTENEILGTEMTTGWWLGHPSEKYDFVNWDDDIPNYMGK